MHLRADSTVGVGGAPPGGGMPTLRRRGFTAWPRRCRRRRNPRPHQQRQGKGNALVLASACVQRVQKVFTQGPAVELREARGSRGAGRESISRNPLVRFPPLRSENVLVSKRALVLEQSLVYRRRGHWGHTSSFVIFVPKRVSALIISLRFEGVGDAKHGLSPCAGSTFCRHLTHPRFHLLSVER